MLSLGGLSASLAFETDELGGFMEARIGERRVVFPSLNTAIEAQIDGDLATVTIVQRFENPLTEPVHATYLFPLNKDAAVNKMVMVVGDERIHAVIQEKRKALKTFEDAKQAGKSAALLEQHRPNMFTQSVANLMPGQPITVRISYVQTVPKVDGDYELVLPLVVGPRYEPAPARDTAARVDRVADVTGDETQSVSEAASSGQWHLESLPQHPPVAGLALPSTIASERVSINIDLDAGMPIAHLASDTHVLQVDNLQGSDNRAAVQLAKGATIDNRDFVLRYRLQSAAIQTGFLTYKDTRGGFFSLLVEPPANPDPGSILAREVVFLLDTSGSMSGRPMDASKAFMREDLRRLRRSDQFRIIRFSDSASEFSTFPTRATVSNIERGIRYAQGLRGGGGTVMTAGIEQALGAPVMPGVMRLVVFLTDGYIGNEAEILNLVHQQLGDARLYAFGVGTAVNRFLLAELGNIGRGFTRYMDPTESVEAVAVELAEKIQSPVLSDINVDWGQMQVSEVYPANIPDLFAGQSVRIQGRYTGHGTHRIVVKGTRPGHKASLPLTVELPAKTEGPNTRDTVATIWARSAVKEAMRALRLNPNNRGAQKARVVDLGLRFGLSTRWTSLVAVSEQVYNRDSSATPTLPVPLPMVKGVSGNAYPNPAQKLRPVASATVTSTQQNGAQFAGGSTPEPETLAGMGLLALLWLVGRGRRNTGKGSPVPGSRHLSTTWFASWESASGKR
jgi:Ca-activated chloride channel family protein